MLNNSESTNNSFYFKIIFYSNVACFNFAVRFEMPKFAPCKKVITNYRSAPLYKANPSAMKKRTL